MRIVDRFRFERNHDLIAIHFLVDFNAIYRRQLLGNGVDSIGFSFNY